MTNGDFNRTIPNATGKPRVAVLLPSETRKKCVSPAAEEHLAAFADVVSADDKDLVTENLPDMLTGVSAVLTGWKSPRLPESQLRKNGELRFVSHSAGSVYPIGVAKAIEQGAVRVSHAASVIAEAVAEFCITQALVHLRRFRELDAGLRNGEEWFELRTTHLGDMLCAQTVGIVGVGYVGRLVIGLLKAFGSKIIAYDPYLSDERAAGLGIEKAALDALFERSDVVSFHAPSIPETKHMIAAPQLALLKDGALLINTARASIIDEEALLAELQKGRFHAALDVFEEEPLPGNSPFRNLPNVYLSPHASGHSLHTYFQQGQVAIDEIQRFLAGEALRHEVTREMLASMA